MKKVKNILRKIKNFLFLPLHSAGEEISEFERHVCRDGNYYKD